MCPVITFMEELIDRFTQLEHNLDLHLKESYQTNLSETNTREHLKKIKTTVDKGIEDNLIDSTQSLIKYEQVMFPKESNQQVYIGSLDPEGRRSGQGSLSDGIMLYKGEWEEDKRHGFGIQVYEDGEIFAGQWHHGKPVIGRWVFDNQQVFYGIFNRTGDEETEWMLGLKSEDYLRAKKAEKFFKENETWTQEDLEENKIKKGFNNVRNIFYQDDEASGLMNVFMNEEDKLDILALTGEEPMRIQTITFLDGIVYKGMWRNFEPNMIGYVKVPGQSPLKLLTRTGRTLAYKKIKHHPDDEAMFESPPSEPDLIYMVSIKRTIKKLEIEFRDGTCYSGAVNENLEFHGYGVLQYLDNSFEHGLFTYNDGFLVKFSNECIKNLENIDKNKYFFNSYEYLEEDQKARDVWVEVIEGWGKTKKFYYKGGWYDLHPEGRGYFKFNSDQKRMTCTTSEQLMFAIVGYSKEIYLERIEACENGEEEDDEELGDDIKNRVKMLRSKVDDYEFGDGSRYIGMAYSDERYYYPHGFGFYYEKNGTVHQGYWEKGTMIIDKKNTAGMSEREIRALHSGLHVVEYENGIKYRGEWNNYRWQDEGELVHPDGKVETLDFKKIFKEYDEMEKNQEMKDELILRFMTKKTGGKLRRNLGKKPVLYVDFAFFTNGGKREGILNLYKRLLERQKQYVGKLIEHDFIDGESVEYNPASVVGGPTTIGNGFEIYWMDPVSKTKRKIENGANNLNKNSFELTNLYVYNEQEQNSKVQLNYVSDSENLDKKIQEIDSQAYFKQIYTPEKKIDFSSTYESFHNLKPISPFIQITYTGLLISTQNLFQISPEIQNIEGPHPLTPLSSDKTFLYAMYHLNKINGISEVKKDKILFYNGDEYQFIGPERSFGKSLGNYRKESKLDHVTRNSNHGAVYWSKMFSSVGICRLDPEFVLELKDEEFDLRKIDKGNKYQITFNQKEIFESSWYDGIPFGNGYFVDTRVEEEEEEESEEEDYNIQDLRKKTVKTSLLRPSSLGWSSLRSGTTGALDKQFWYKYRVYDSEPASDTLLMALAHKKTKHYRRVMMNIYETLRSITSMVAQNNLNTSFYLNLPDFETEIIQEFKVYFENNVSTNAMSIYKGILNKLQRHNRPTLEMRIDYPNGDVFEGEKDKRGLAIGNGEYFWSEGFKYEGDFFLNEPFGEGVIQDCFGNRLKGYVFRGHVLKQSYGLEDLKEELKKYDSKTGLKLKNFDLDLISDSEMMLGSGKFKHIHIQYGSMYSDIKESGILLEKMLKDIEEGEKDYKEEWSDLLRADVKQLLMSEEAVLNDQIEAGKINLDDFARAINDLISKRKERGMDNNKYEFILEKLNISKISKWATEQIIELVRDDEEEGVGLVYSKFRAEGQELKFFNLKDSNKRNLLMIAAHLGHRQILLDMLTALRRYMKDRKSNSEIYLKAVEEVKKLLMHRDDVGNNMIDLTCIKGYDVDLQEVYTYKANPKDNLRLIGESFMAGLIDEASIEESSLIMEEGQKVSKIAKKNIKEIARVYTGPQIYFEVLRMLKDDKRSLFNEGSLTYEHLYRTISHFQDNNTNSSDVFFISNRAICLESLFHFMTEFNFKLSTILSKNQYHKKLNNPLHFTIFWGDLHSTLAILKQNSSIMFWRNHNNELPPHVIRFSGKNKFKANAVFASVLNELTRHFNFKVVTNLLITEEGVLKTHKKKVGVDDSKDPETGKKEAQKILNQIKEGNNFEFDEENIYLYKNNYILRHDELCKRYLEYLKKKSAYKQLKKKYGVMKWLLFAEVSELESLQRNFLDFYKGKFSKYHKKSIVKKYRENLQDLLTWYVFIFGDAEIYPEIYTLMGMDPFKLVLAGRNIFHFMCENNSHSLLSSFLNYLYEKCHSRNFDISIETYEHWDRKSLTKKKHEKLKMKLNKPTRIGQDTCAHLCIMDNSEECLDLLLSHNVDIDTINLRGRTVREFLKDRAPYNLTADVTLRPTDISSEFIEYLTKDILTTCRQHSLKYEYIDEAEHEDLQIILRGSMYQLTDDLAAVRNSVLTQMKNFSFGYKESHDRIRLIKAFLKNILDIRRMNKHERTKKIDDFRNIHIGHKQNDKELNKEMIYFLLTALEGERFVFLPQREIMETFFVPEFLATMKKFKYKKYEKRVKKEFLEILDKVDFSKPLPASLKNKFSMDQLFCIEIKIKNIQSESNIEYRDLIEKQVVLNQINNIRRKYMKYGGGIRVELLKGFTTARRKRSRCYLKGKKYKAWYILITVSDTLLKKIATEKQLEAYNFKNKYHTVFFENAIDAHELEPLRHLQKVKIVMELINEEFDIDMFKSKGLVIKYFPIHDYKQRNLIYKIWSQNKWKIHFWDAFSQIDTAGLQVLSFISFYHGIQQGFYFGFLALYTNAMSYLAIFGLCLSLPMILGWDLSFIQVFSPLIIGMWSSIFVNMWQRREKELAFSFDALEDEAIKTVRLKYKGKSMIDEGTLSISKKVEDRWIVRIFFTTMTFILGACFVISIYILVNSLTSTTSSEGNAVLGTAFTFGIGVLNGTLNFIVSLIFQRVVNKLVIMENHAYEEDMRRSKIMKKVTFKIFSSLFTLIAQILIERRTYSFVSLQVLSNLLTSAILNYTMSVGRPFFIYLISRYKFISYVLKFKYCCCKPLKGKLEIFKEEIIRRMLLDEDTRDTFIRYCLDNKVDPKLLEELKTKKWVGLKKEIKKLKINRENRTEAKKRKLEKIFKKYNKNFEGFEKEDIVPQAQVNQIDDDDETEHSRTKKIPRKTNRVHPSDSISPVRRKLILGDNTESPDKKKSDVNVSFSSSHRKLNLDDEENDVGSRANKIEIKEISEWNLPESRALNEKKGSGEEWSLGDKGSKRKISVHKRKSKVDINPPDGKKKKVQFGPKVKKELFGDKKSKLRADSSMRVNQSTKFLKVIKKKYIKKEGAEDLPDKLDIRTGNRVILDHAEKVELQKEYKGPKHNLGVKRKNNIRLRLREEFTKYVLGREKIIETSYMLDLGKLEESFYSSLLIQFTFICFFTPYLLIAGLVSYVFNICIIVLVMALYTKITRRPISRRVGNIEIWNQLYNMISYLGIIFNAIVIVTTGDQLGADVLERIVPGNRSSFRTVFDAQNALLVVKFLLSIMIPKLPQWIGEMQMRERLVRERERKKNSKILTRLSKERIKKEIDEKKKAFANAKKLKKDKIKQNRIQEKIKAQAMVLEDDDTRSLKYFFENNKKMEVFEKMSFRVNSKTEEMMEMPRPRIEVKKVKKTNRKKLDNGY